MTLPSEVRKNVALRLLESVEPDTAFDAAAENWLRSEVAAAYEALKEDPSRAISVEDVRARFEDKWVDRAMTSVLVYERRPIARGL